MMSPQLEINRYFLYCRHPRALLTGIPFSGRKGNSLFNYRGLQKKNIDIFLLKPIFFVSVRGNGSNIAVPRRIHRELQIKIGLKENSLSKLVNEKRVTTDYTDCTD
jgi:hypothetical protein